MPYHPAGRAVIKNPYQWVYRGACWATSSTSFCRKGWMLCYITRFLHRRADYEYEQRMEREQEMAIGAPYPPLCRSLWKRAFQNCSWPYTAGGREWTLAEGWHLTCVRGPAILLGFRGASWGLFELAGCLTMPMLWICILPFCWNEKPSKYSGWKMIKYSSILRLIKAV